MILSLSGGVRVKVSLSPLKLLASLWSPNKRKLSLQPNFLVPVARLALLGYVLGFPPVSLSTSKPLSFAGGLQSAYSAATKGSTRNTQPTFVLGQAGSSGPFLWRPDTSGSLSKERARREHVLQGLGTLKIEASETPAIGDSFGINQWLGKFPLFGKGRNEEPTHADADTNTDPDAHRETETERRTHRRTDTHAQAHRQTDTPTHRHRHTDTQTHRHTHTHRQPDRSKAAREADRQANRDTHTQTHTYPILGLAGNKTGNRSVKSPDSTGQGSFCARKKGMRLSCVRLLARVTTAITGPPA